MNKYERKFKTEEKIPSFINSIALKALFHRFNRNVLKTHDFIKHKDLDNSLSYYLIFGKLSLYSDEEFAYIQEHIINKMDTNEIYRFYLQHLSDLLCLRDYKKLTISLLSFMRTGLIKDAEIYDDGGLFIELVMPNGEKIRFSNASANKDSVSKFRGNCHSVTNFIINSDILDEERDNELAVVLEKNALFGSGYHSFVIVDNIVRDYAHNIRIDYDNYLKLINPTVIVKEKVSVVKEEINELEKDKSFSICSYSNILKYGMSKQLIKTKRAS